MRRFFVLAILLSAASTIASAAHPLTWYLSGVQFAGGVTGSGSFVYDADTNVFSSINLTVGTDTFVALHPTFASSATVIRLVTVASGSLNNTPYLVLNPSGGSLTNAGGTIALSTADPYQEFTCSDTACGFTTQLRHLTAGSLTTTNPNPTPTATGVPALSDFGLGLAATLLAACGYTMLRKRASHTA